MPARLSLRRLPQALAVLLALLVVATPGLVAAEDLFDPYGAPMISLPSVLPASDNAPLQRTAVAAREHDDFPGPPVGVLPASSDWEWHVRPTGFIYHTYWANAQEPRMSTQLVDETDNGPLADSMLGGRLGLIRYGPRDRAEGFQLDILVGASLRQDPDQGLDVVSTDFRVDIPFTYGIGPHRFKFGYYHVSSHTGDEFLLKNPSHVRLNFYRDVLVLGYSYYATPKIRLYTEAGWAFASEFSEPWEFQFGLDYGPAGPTGGRGAPFFAVNVHLRQELDFSGNLAVQAGWAWRGRQPGDGTLRTGLYYYNGGSPQFSFFRENEQQTGWGLWYDF